MSKYQTIIYYPNAAKTGLSPETIDTWVQMPKNAFKASYAVLNDKGDPVIIAGISSIPDYDFTKIYSIFYGEIKFHEKSRAKGPREQFYHILEDICKMSISATGQSATVPTPTSTGSQDG